VWRKPSLPAALPPTRRRSRCSVPEMSNATYAWWKANKQNRGYQSRLQTAIGRGCGSVVLGEAPRTSAQKSNGQVVSAPCPLYPPKRTFGTARCNVCFGPSRHWLVLFDHLVRTGGQPV